MLAFSELLNIAEERDVFESHAFVARLLVSHNINNMRHKMVYRYSMRHKPKRYGYRVVTIEWLTSSVFVTSKRQRRDRGQIFILDSGKNAKQDKTENAWRQGNADKIKQVATRGDKWNRIKSLSLKAKKFGASGNEEWYFSVVDVVEALTDSPTPSSVLG